MGVLVDAARVDHWYMVSRIDVEAAPIGEAVPLGLLGR
jgi:hypothetical protein